MNGFLLNASNELRGLVEATLPSVVQVANSQRGAGAGVIWRADGVILTNWHVVAGKGDIQVLLRDGRTLPAKVVNQSEVLDLALLQVEADTLPAAMVDDSSTLRVGEVVVAIGHPWGQKDFVTAGIVSNIGTLEDRRSGRKATYIRSDVALAPGNSGGPLLNSRGAVIGINAMIFGGDLSVAIPSAVAEEWVAGLPSRRVQLNIELQAVELPSAWAQAQRATAALLVTATPHQSPLLVGDLLLDVAGEPLHDPRTFATALGRRGGGERVRLNLLRGGQLHPLDVTVGELEHSL